MGNSTVSRQQKSLTRNSFSFDAGEVFKVQNKVFSQKKEFSSAQIINKSTHLNEDSHLKLKRLNKKNDQLRKQLIRLNQQTGIKLKKKNYSVQKQIQTNNPQKIALTKQLQNGYKQIDRYKKILIKLKEQKIEPSASYILLQKRNNEINQQITFILQQISLIKKQNQRQNEVIEKYFESEQQKNAIQDIIRLKNISKQMSIKQRKLEPKEKRRHQYLLQLQRKLREIRGEYLPQFKSYANKNFVSQQNKQKSQQINQIKKIIQKIQKLKLNIDQAQKSKTIRNDNITLIQQKIEKSQRQIQRLKKQKIYYRKQLDQSQQQNENKIKINKNRNIDTKQKEESKIKENGMKLETITKGKDIEGQNKFDDKQTLSQYKEIKLTGLKVHFDKNNNLNGIQFEYQCDGKIRLGISNGQMNQPQESLSLAAGDEIVGLKGMFSKQGGIQYLFVYSLKGIRKAFGRELTNGLTFNVRINQYQRIRSMAGACFFDGINFKINKLTFSIEIIKFL